MLIKKALIATAALVALTGSAFAQLRVASVDMQRASQRYWKVTSERQKLAEDNRRLSDYTQTVQDQIDALMKERQTALDDSQNPALSTDKQDEAKKTVQDKEDKIMALRENVQNEQRRFQMSAQQTQSQIEDDIRAATKTVAQKNGIDVVYPTQVVLYCSVDLTDQVITQLNSTAPAQSAATPAAGGAAAPAAPAPAAGK